MDLADQPRPDPLADQADPLGGVALDPHLGGDPGLAGHPSENARFVDVVGQRFLAEDVLAQLDRGKGIPWKGNYSSWLEQKQKRLAVEEKQESERQKTLQRELEWIRMSPKGRRSKSKARIKAYDELVKAAKDRSPQNAQIIIPVGERLGDVRVGVGSHEPTVRGGDDIGILV